MMSEVGVLKLRRDFYQQNIDLGDQNFMVFIESSPANIKASLKDIWQKRINQDEAKANETSVKKMESTRIAFQKDKAQNAESIIEEAPPNVTIPAPAPPPAVRIQEPQSFGYHIEEAIETHNTPGNDANPPQTQSNVPQTFGYRQSNSNNYKNQQHPHTTSNRRNQSRPPRFQNQQNSHGYNNQNNYNQQHSKNDQARRYPERNRQQTQTYGQPQYSTYQRGPFHSSH